MNQINQKNIDHNIDILVGIAAKAKNILYDSDKLLELTLKEARKTYYFKKLSKRTFKDIPGFYSYNEAINNLAVSILLIPQVQDKIFNCGKGKQDFTLIQKLYTCYRAEINPNFPVLAPSKNILKAFFNTTLSTKIKLNIPFKDILIIFPHDCDNLKTPDEGDVVTSLFITYQDKEHPNVNFGNHMKEFWLGNKFKNMMFHIEEPDTNMLTWAASTKNGFTYGGKIPFIDGAYFLLDEVHVQINSFNVGSMLAKDPNYNSEADAKFSKQLEYLIYKMLFYINSDATRENKEQVKRYGQRQSLLGYPKTKEFEPIYLGNNYRIKETYKEGISKKTSSSKKISHLRRGHMRDQRVGKRDDYTIKPIWIEPTFVNWNYE